MKPLNILLVCACMTTLAAGAAEQPQDPAAAPDSDPVICKRVAPVGTRISKKICMKASEWRRVAQGGRDAVDSMQRRGQQWDKSSN